MANRGRWASARPLRTPHLFIGATIDRPEGGRAGASRACRVGFGGQEGGGQMCHLRRVGDRRLLRAMCVCIIRNRFLIRVVTTFALLYQNYHNPATMDFFKSSSIINTGIGLSVRVFPNRNGHCRKTDNSHSHSRHLLMHRAAATTRVKRERERGKETVQCSSHTRSNLILGQI